MPGIVRWLKFNAVGFGGILVQLAALAILTSGLRMNYFFATGLAVEAAIVHNFFWHQRYTWADRPQAGGLWRFLKFNFTNGALSIAGNIALMALLVGKLHLHYLLANGISIASCSVANFLVSDRFVFDKTGYTATGAAANPRTLITCAAASRPERMQSGTPIPR